MTTQDCFETLWPLFALLALMAAGELFVVLSTRPPIPYRPRRRTRKDQWATWFAWAILPLGAVLMFALVTL